MFSLLASIHLEYRYIPTKNFCSRPHLDTLSYRFERHVLLQAGPSFEGNHGLVYTDVSTWLVNSSYLIGQDIYYWPDLAQLIIVWTPSGVLVEIVVKLMKGYLVSYG